MINEENNLNKPSWAVGVQLFSEISGWIVGPIVIALILGKWLDGKFGTEPWIFIALAAFGFLITIYGIVKIVKNYQRKIKNGN